MYLPEVPVPAEFCIILFHEFQFPPLEAPLGPVVELYISKKNKPMNLKKKY